MIHEIGQAFTSNSRDFIVVILVSFLVIREIIAMSVLLHRIFKGKYVDWSRIQATLDGVSYKLDKMQDSTEEFYKFVDVWLEVKIMLNSELKHLNENIVEIKNNMSKRNTEQK